MVSEQVEKSPPAQVGDSLMGRLVAEAWQATEVVAGEVEQSTREAAFKLVLEALLRNEPRPAGEESLSRSNDSRSMDTDSANPIDISYADPDQRAAAIADYLGIEYAAALDLFNLEDSEPILHIHRTKLSNTRAKAVREVTLLVAAGRAALGLDTGTNHVRFSANQLDVLDASNFGSTLAGMKEIALRGRAKSKNRLIRLRGAGVAEARELAARIVGE